MGNLIQNVTRKSITVYCIFVRINKYNKVVNVRNIKKKIVKQVFEVLCRLL